MSLHNIILAVAGNFAWPQLLDLTEKHCGHWQGGPVGRHEVRETAGSGAFSVLTKDKVTQENVLLLSTGPAAESPLRYAADTLALALGDDTGSRLYWALIDPGLADSADSSFQDYQGTGSFFTSFSCEPDQTEENLAIVLDVLRDVQRQGITEEELHQAKSKIASRVVRGNERPMGRMQALGMIWTYLHEYRTVDDELKNFDNVTLSSIRELLDRYPLDHVTALALGPLKTLPISH